MKSRKEKYLFWSLITTIIIIFMVLWLWGKSLYHETDDGITFGVITGILVFVLMALNSKYQRVVTERSIQETVDRIMDAIVEFRKETIKDTEQKILKKINKK